MYKWSATSRDKVELDTVTGQTEPVQEGGLFDDIINIAEGMIGKGVW